MISTLVNRTGLGTLTFFLFAFPAGAQSLSALCPPHAYAHCDSAEISLTVGQGLVLPRYHALLADHGVLCQFLGDDGCELHLQPPTRLRALQGIEPPIHTLGFDPSFRRIGVGLKAQQVAAVDDKFPVTSGRDDRNTFDIAATSSKCKRASNFDSAC